MLHALFYSQLAYAGGTTGTAPGIGFGLAVIVIGAIAVFAAFWRMSGGPGPNN